MGTQKRKVRALEISGRRQEFIDLYRTATDLWNVADAFPELFGTNIRNRRNAVAQVAQELGLTRPQILRYPSIGEATPVSKEELPDEAIENQVAFDRKIQQVTAERNNLKRLYAQATKEGAQWDRLIDMLRDSVTALPPVQVDPPSPDLPDTTNHTVVLHLSDWHIGETVTPEETGGLGAYNMDIVARRLGLVAEKTAELVELRRNSINVPNLKVFLGGDMVGGVIHEELAETNGANIVQQASDGAYMIAQALTSIASFFDDVEVVCVGGNHGRMHKKPRAKERELSFDYILYQIVGFLVAKQPNIRMRISKSFYELVNVDGFKILLMHGDSIKGSLGIPFYGVERASSRLRSLLDMVGERFDVVMIGHFHDPMVGDRWITNGSGKGIDGYSAGMLHLGSQPSQNMLYVHPNHGIVATEKLFLSPADDRPEIAVNRALPDVWAQA